MEDIFQKLSLGAKLWDTTSYLPTPEIEVTETWLSDKVRTEMKSVKTADAVRWLSQTTKTRPQPAPAGEPMEDNLVQRIVWVRVDTDERQLYMAKDVQKSIYAGLGLDMAWKYSRTFLSGFVELPETNAPGGSQRTFVFNYLPKLSVLWSHITAEGKPPITSAIVLVKKEKGERNLTLYQSTLLQSFPKTMLYQSHFLAYTLALLLSVQNDQTQLFVQRQITDIESQSGHHQFKSRPEGSPERDWPALSAKASGLSTKLASVEKKRVMVESLLADIEEECKVVRDLGEHEVVKEGAGLLSGQVRVLKRRHVAQGLDTKYILKRVEIQIQALFHLITSDEASASLDLTNEMSSIAWSTYRDAASMKTLAVVTMLFLPGSFVSALFSTDLFDWDNAPSDSIFVKGMPQLTLFWVVTIPLTVFVFMLYGLWLWWVRRDMKGKKLEQQKVKDDRRKAANDLMKREDSETDVNQLGRTGTLTRIGTYTVETWKGVKGRAFATATSAS